MTGSYGMYVTMKNNQQEQVSFSFTFWEENKNIQKEGVTNTKISEQLGVRAVKVKIRKEQTLY